MVLSSPSVCNQDFEPKKCLGTQDCGLYESLRHGGGAVARLKKWEGYYVVHRLHNPVQDILSASFCEFLAFPLQRNGEFLNDVYNSEFTSTYSKWGADYDKMMKGMHYDAPKTVGIICNKYFEKNEK